MCRSCCFFPLSCLSLSNLKTLTSKTKLKNQHIINYAFYVSYPEPFFIHSIKLQIKYALMIKFLIRSSTLIGCSRKKNHSGGIDCATISLPLWRDAWQARADRPVAYSTICRRFKNAARLRALLITVVNHAPAESLGAACKQRNIPDAFTISCDHFY